MEFNPVISPVDDPCLFAGSEWVAAPARRCSLSSVLAQLPRPLVALNSMNNFDAMLRVGVLLLRDCGSPVDTVGRDEPPDTSSGGRHIARPRGTSGGLRVSSVMFVAARMLRA